MEMMRKINEMMARYGFEPPSETEDVYSALIKVYAFMEFLERKFLERSPDGGSQYAELKPSKVNVYPGQFGNA